MTWRRGLHDLLMEGHRRWGEASGNSGEGTPEASPGCRKPPAEKPAGSEPSLGGEGEPQGTRGYTENP